VKSLAENDVYSSSGNKWHRVINGSYYHQPINEINGAERGEIMASKA
jgi:hypothetical protein